MRTTQIQLREVLSLGKRSRIERSLRALPGVQEVKFQPEAKRLTIEHEEVSEERLREALATSGVTAEVIPDDAAVLAPSVPQMKTDKER